MPDRQPPYSPFYIARLNLPEERASKIDIGSYVANTLVKGDQCVFISGGTTAAIASLEILMKYPSVNVVTHSIPVAWHVMEFKFRKYLNDSATIEVVGGHVDPMSGVIAHDRLGKISSEIFIYAPRSLNERGVSANHNEKAIDEAWKCHAMVILLATYSRLLDKGGELIKHIGKIRQGSRDKKRGCVLVIPATLPEGFSEQETKRTTEILKGFEENQVVIHRAPRCKRSKWHDYFEESSGR